MNKEFRRMQQLAGLLTEVHIQPANIIIPKNLKEILEKLEEKSYFTFDSGSPEDDEPIEDNVNIDAEYMDGAISEDEYNTVKKYVGKQFVSDVFLHPNDIPNPNKPRSGFNTLTKVYMHHTDCYVNAEIPNIDENGIQTGWFNINGEYISTVKPDDLNEVNVSPSNIPRFTIHKTPIYKDVPDWDQTPDNEDVRYIDHINYNSPKHNTNIEGYEQRDDVFVERKNPNPIIFGIIKGSEQDEIFQELMSYLRSNGIQYNMDEYDDGEDGELYLSVSLDNLKRKQLIKR